MGQPHARIQATEIALNPQKLLEAKTTPRGSLHFFGFLSKNMRGIAANMQKIPNETVSAESPSASLSDTKNASARTLTTTPQLTASSLSRKKPNMKRTPMSNGFLTNLLRWPLTTNFGNTPGRGWRYLQRGIHLMYTGCGERFSRLPSSPIRHTQSR